MKKLLFLTILLTLAICSFGQSKPTNPEFKQLKSPIDVTHYWDDLYKDYWNYSGYSGWNKYWTAKKIQHKLDSLATATTDTLDYYKLHSAVTLGTSNGLSLSGQQLSLGLSSTSTTGALSSTDWNTFNSKETAIGTKNTAFNKNFGTTSGTVLEGSTASGFAPASGSGNYIQNNPSTIQSGGVFIDGKINIGSTSTNSTDPVINVARTITGAGNSHGFSDSSIFSKESETAYNSYDARITLAGSNNFDHYVSFQAAPTFSSTGFTRKHYGLFTYTAIDAGTIYDNYGVYTANPSGNGTIGNNYGVYIPQQDKGAVNYAIYTTGNTPSYFGGATRIGGRLSIGTTDATVEDLLIRGTGEKLIRLYQSGYNYWDIKSPLESTNLTIGDVSGTYLSLQNGGNLGIGYLTGTEITNNKLAVNGTIYSSGTVTASNGTLIGGNLTSGRVVLSSGTNTISTLANGSDGQILTLASGSPTWASLSNGQVTAALGFTPYNSTNPAGYITGTLTSGYIPVATESGSLGNSKISQSGTTATVNGNLAATDRNAYYIGSKLMISDYSWGGDNTNVWVGGATNSTVTGSAAYEGNYNNAIGVNALFSNTTGAYNNAIGVGALYYNTTGYHNNAIGVNALRYNTTGNYNNAIGVDALSSNTTGYFNNAIGVNALYSNTTGYFNNAIGVNALLNNTTGYYNNAIGVDALSSNTTGYFNNAIGVYALYELTEGTNNSALGYNTGRGITTGSNNTILGNNVTGLSAGLTNNIILATGDGTIRARFDGTNWSLSSLSGTGTRLTTASSTGQLGAITNGSDGQILTLASGSPTWANAPISVVDLSINYYSDFITVSPSSGTGTYVNAATTSSAGIMTAADKLKLNSSYNYNWLIGNVGQGSTYVPHNGKVLFKSTNGSVSIAHTTSGDDRIVDLQATGGSGTVTSITAGTGLSGGTITTSGTISLSNTTVTAGTYTAANITVDSQGRITAAASGSGGSMAYPSGSGIPVVVSGTSWGTTLGTSGSGSVALTNSPSFTTPSLGVATATSINGLVLEENATSHNIRIGSGTSFDGNPNEIVIGYNVTGHGGNSVTIGNTSITDNYFNGVIHSNGQTQNSQTLTSSASPTFNYLNGANATLTLSANVTSFAMSNIPDGGNGKIYIPVSSYTFYLNAISASGLTIGTSGVQTLIHGLLCYIRIGSTLVVYIE